MTVPPPGPQTGILVFARHQNELAKDGLILNDARGYAAHILDLDPMLVSPANASLAAELKKDKYQSRDYSRIS